MINTVPGYSLPTVAGDDDVTDDDDYEITDLLIVCIVLTALGFALLLIVTYVCVDGHLRAETK